MTTSPDLPLRFGAIAYQTSRHTAAPPIHPEPPESRDRARPIPDLARQRNQFPKEGMPMKKIAITVAAALALGVAACTPAANDAGNNATDVNATETEAGNDINGAAYDVNGAAAVSSTDNALDSVGDAAANTASDVGNAAADAGNAVANAVD
jgi:hypothetical protein